MNFTHCKKDWIKMKRGKYRKAVFFVVYARTKTDIEYLILKRKLHWKGWEFPKGGLKRFETKRHAIKREIREEVGIKKIIKIKRFNFSGRYKYDKKYPDRKEYIGQSFSLYGVEVKKPEKNKIRVDKKEHSDYKWLGFKDAIKKLTWDNQRKSLRIVNGWGEKEVEK